MVLHAKGEKEGKRLGRGFVEICAAGDVRQLIRPGLRDDIRHVDLKPCQSAGKLGPASRQAICARGKSASTHSRPFLLTAMITHPGISWSPSNTASARFGMSADWALNFLGLIFNLDIALSLSSLDCLICSKCGRRMNRCCGRFVRHHSRPRAHVAPTHVLRFPADAGRAHWVQPVNGTKPSRTLLAEMTLEPLSKRGLYRAGQTAGPLGVEL